MELFVLKVKRERGCCAKSSDRYRCILFHFRFTVVNLVERASSIRVFISAILRAFLTELLLKRPVCGSSTTVQKLDSALQIWCISVTTHVGHFTSDKQASQADKQCIDEQQWYGEFEPSVSDEESENDREDITDSDNPTLEECFEYLELEYSSTGTPFPSKIFALLYLLVHSPHPVVSCYPSIIILFIFLIFKGREDPVVMDLMC